MSTAEQDINPYLKYLAYLAGLQEKRIRKLFDKAAKIIEVVGCPQGDNQEQMVATMYYGDDRYRVCQPKGKKTAPITIIKGGAETLQPEVPTDLEECGVTKERAEIARLCVTSGSLEGTMIKGDKVVAGKYVLDLPTVEIVLGLWNDFLQDK